MSPKANGTMTFDEWLKEEADKMQFDEDNENTMVRVAWDKEGPSNRRIRINIIDDFDARGMRCLYGRTDLFPEKCRFNMTIWKDRNGRILVRFWSRSIDVEWRSFEVIGLVPKLIPSRQKGGSFDDGWIPQSLRDEYDQWISEEW